MSSRNQYNGRFKAQVALEAIKNQRTIGEIAHEYGIHPSQNLSQRRLGYTNGRSMYWMNCPMFSPTMGGERNSKTTRSFSQSYISRSASRRWNWTG